MRSMLADRGNLRAPVLKHPYFACRMPVESSPRWGEGRVRGSTFYRNIIGYLSAMMESEAEGTPPLWSAHAYVF